MKLKFMPFLRSVILLTLLVSVFSSCKKDDPDPDYVGTWVVLGTYNDGDQTIEMKESITFSKNSFTQKRQLKNPVNSAWLDFTGIKGTFTVADKKMNITITEAGMSSISSITGLPTGQIEYYKSTDDVFTDLLELFELTATFQSEYVVAGSEITIKIDYNNDSDYNDDGEVITYTRQ